MILVQVLQTHKIEDDGGNEDQSDDYQEGQESYESTFLMTHLICL